MDRDLPNLEVRGKTARQARSVETKRRIVRAAIDIIAERDLADLTHRLVAERAEVGLAATTYYYKTKDDIVADVSNTLLNDYVSAFENYARRYRCAPAPPWVFVNWSAGCCATRSAKTAPMPCAGWSFCWNPSGIRKIRRSGGCGQAGWKTSGRRS